ncbi:MAG: FecR domain-containing protein [Alkalispirochaeta sp.]
MKRRILVSILVAVATAAFAQSDPVAILEYFDDESELQIRDADNFDVNFYIGIALNPGDQLITGDTAAEIRLDPNGSILRIAPQTRFVVEGLQGRDDAEENAFAMERGRMRMVASRLVRGEASRYSIRTPTAVAGVRGTDFGLSVLPPDDEGEQDGADAGADGRTGEEELFVFSGEVEFESGLTGDTISLGAGERANVFDDEFQPEIMSESDVSNRREGLEFVALDPADVPAPEEEPEDTDEPEPTDVPTEAVPEVSEEPEDDAAGVGDRMFETLARISGLQVGSVTINEETWAQAVFQPRLSVGRLSLEMYLPITYRENLFDAGDWYRPEGNNEWSFGSDQDWSNEPLEALGDLATDVALKIKSLEFGERGDGFYVKTGNLSNLTVGQGLLMRNYANDSDFPTVRRIGFNLGFDLNRWGLETVVNDLAAPEIYAGRMYFRPAMPVTSAAVGLSAITDIAPGNQALVSDVQTADPLFLNVGMDLEVPIVTREIFSLAGFAEGGGLIPYLREDATYDADGDGTGEAIASGLKTDALVDFSSGELRNFGWTAGARGNVTFLDYRVEYRTFDGIFRPGFYGPSYDRLRGTYAEETLRYLANTEADQYDLRTMGVAGEAGATLLGAMYISAGYFWPWEVTDEGTWQGSDQDEFMFSVELRDGLLPFGIETGLTYRRTHFAATVANWGDYQDATLFDADTTLNAYAAYPFNDVVRIVAQVTTATVRDEEGDIVYDDNGQPRMAPTVAIQTQIGF